MSLLGGDKNSPKQKQTSSSVTKNTSIAPSVSGSGPTTVGPTLSDVTNTGKIAITTTDQGAVAAGLQIASKALDTVNSESQASNALASQAAAGQSNTSLKYLVWAGVGVAAIVAAVFIFRKK